MSLDSDNMSSAKDVKRTGQQQSPSSAGVTNSSDDNFYWTMVQWLTVFVLVVGTLFTLTPWQATSGVPPTSALLIIDVQNCFTSGGTLAVGDGDAVIPVINGLRENNLFDVVALTQDWHCADHVSFASQHPHCGDSVTLTYLDNGDLCLSNNTCDSSAHAVNCSSSTRRRVIVEQHLWPDHCIINTTDAQFNPQLVVKPSDIVVYKGYHCQIDSYSGFYDNGQLSSTELDRELSERNVDTVFIVGIATDFCVFYTAKDAVGLGYKTYVVEDATRGVFPASVNQAKSEMRKLGIKLVNSMEVSSIMSMKSAACSGRISLMASSATSLFSLWLLIGSIGRLSSFVISDT